MVESPNPTESQKQVYMLKYIIHSGIINNVITEYLHFQFLCYTNLNNEDT